jgi:hypothetical protein
MSLRSIRATPTLTDAALAGVSAAIVAWVGPDGTDYPAHLYQLDLFRADGFAFWNNDWYAGHPTLVGYSLLYYPLAALLGIKPLAVLSAAGAAAAFSGLTVRLYGRRARWAGRAFALVAAASVLGAAFPYALGLALALAGLWALASGRLGVFALLSALAYGASPLAFLFELVALVAAAPARPPRTLLRPACVAAAIAVAAAAVVRLAPDGGHYPYPPSELLGALAFCAAGAALTRKVEHAATVYRFFFVYAAACLGSYALASDLGGNVARLRLLALPVALLALSLRRFRPLPVAAAVLALAGAWNLSPLAYDLTRSAGDPSAAAAYWRPVIGYLRHSLTPDYRVEVVATADHWEALYLPQAGIAIARGWFRQDDFPENATLYARSLTRAGYLSWLRTLGVRYVVLTDAALDYSSHAEAALLRSGDSGLKPVFRSAEATVFAVPDPAGIVVGPGRPRVLALGQQSLSLELSRPGSYAVALRFSPYLSAGSDCLSRRPDGLTTLVAQRPGRVRIGVSLSTAGALAALTDAGSAC